MEIFLERPPIVCHFKIYLEFSKVLVKKKTLQLQVTNSKFSYNKGYCTNNVQGDTLSAADILQKELYEVNTSYNYTFSDLNSCWLSSRLLYQTELETGETPTTPAWPKDLQLGQQSPTAAMPSQTGEL